VPRASGSNHAEHRQIHRDRDRIRIAIAIAIA
jgi:hypothetical protein